MNKILGVLSIALFFTACGYAHQPRLFDTLPAPRLLAPPEAVLLSKGEALEFRWVPLDFGPEWYYDFRIYRGPSMVASALLKKEKVPSRQSAIRVKSDLFQDNQCYAWSIRLVGVSKSRSNFSVFKVIFRK